MAILSKRGSRRRYWAVFAGAIIPDLFIYAAWLWLTFGLGKTQSEIWNQIYFEAPMQALASFFNSVPLFSFVAVAGLFIIKSKPMHLAGLFAFAALIHISLDFPFHAHDAYAYFAPFTEWRFHSPLSYYEADHHARWVNLLELSFVLISSFVLWRRFPHRWVKITLAIICLLAFLQALAMQFA